MRSGAIAREHVRWVHSDSVCALSEGLAGARPRKIFIEPMFVARVRTPKPNCILKSSMRANRPCESRKSAALSSFWSQNVCDRHCDGLRSLGRYNQYTEQYVVSAFLACAVGSRVRQKGVLNTVLHCNMIRYQPFHCTKDVILLKQKAFDALALIQGN
jgi:hypothetical protein